LQLLEETLRQDFPNPELLQLVGDSRNSSANIEAVMRALLSAANVKLISYIETTPILDIEAALNIELEQMTQLRRR
ncbi:MAG: hypothetical protein WBV22_05830, partial [Anaerolineaceae bacterium]